MPRSITDTQPRSLKIGLRMLWGSVWLSVATTVGIALQVEGPERAEVLFLPLVAVAGYAGLLGVVSRLRRWAFLLTCFLCATYVPGTLVQSHAILSAVPMAAVLFLMQACLQTAGLVFLLRRDSRAAFKRPSAAAV